MKNLCTTALFTLFIVLSHTAAAQTVMSRQRLKEIETYILNAAVSSETGVIKIDPPSDRLVHYGPRLYFASGLQARPVYDTHKGSPGLELMWKSKKSKLSNSIIINPNGTIGFALIDGLSYHPLADKKLADSVSTDEPLKAVPVDEKTGEQILTRLTLDIIRQHAQSVSAEVVTDLKKAEPSTELAVGQAGTAP